MTTKKKRKNGWNASKTNQRRATEGLDAIFRSTGEIGDVTHKMISDPIVPDDLAKEYFVDLVTNAAHGLASLNVPIGEILDSLHTAQRNFTGEFIEGE